MYEQPSTPLAPDEHGPRLLLRLSCWIIGHAGEYLPILKAPESSLKAGKLLHGEVVEVRETLFYKPQEENDYSKIPGIVFILLFFINFSMPC